MAKFAHWGLNKLTVCYCPRFAMFSYFCLASSKVARTACFSVSVFHAALLRTAEISLSIHFTKYLASSALPGGAPGIFT
jgi:hypothetical protein